MKLRENPPVPDAARYGGIGGLGRREVPGQARELAAFRTHYLQSRERYRRTGLAAALPAELVAALHWREHRGDFGLYLHTGEPLGQPARGGARESRDIPFFGAWQPAAVDALGRHPEAYRLSGIGCGTQDLAVFCVFAEVYLCLGYRRLGVPSPDILSGTTGYERGLLLARGYDPDAVDPRPGILRLVWEIVPSAAPI